MRLSAADKRVVQAFVQRAPATGRLLDTDGRTLRKMGMGGEKVAVWRGDRIAVVSTESTRSDQAILRQLAAYAGKPSVAYAYSRVGHPVSLRFATGGDAFYADQYDGWLEAFAPGDPVPVGRLDWSVYRGRYYVKMLEVRPDLRRTGIASALFLELFRQEGITRADVDPGMQTEAGAAFLRGAH